ncbi:hypothetical protein ARMSODRAFT_978153 [Armillaria solidipes]|uniref:Uncharacterized protein n=1 Tax=Armillaria solidipes TaxID=1076256 RepID=A0A2H3BF79_9AGAR|nr:hypothetical protein ARMSODRAFT_978153 [Armillaria solidipes]
MGAAVYPSAISLKPELGTIRISINLTQGHIAQAYQKGSILVLDFVTIHERMPSYQSSKIYPRQLRGGGLAFSTTALGSSVIEGIRGWCALVHCRSWQAAKDVLLQLLQARGHLRGITPSEVKGVGTKRGDSCWDTIVYLPAYSAGGLHIENLLLGLSTHMVQEHLGHTNFTSFAFSISQQLRGLLKQEGRY